MISAYFCFTASSSGVEQAFSQLDRCHLQNGRRRVGADAFRRSLQALSFQSDKAAHSKIIEDARVLFAAGRIEYKKNRGQGRKVRLDCGVRGKERNTSEAAWLRKRKLAVEGAVQSLPSAGSAAPDIQMGDLPEQMQKECRRLQAATVKRLCEAKDDNYLLPGEDPTEEQMKDWKQKRKENDKKNRSREAEIKSGQLMVTKPIEYRLIGSYLQGAVLWFPQANLLERQVALNFGAHVLTDSLENASVFVVTDDTPEPRAQWYAVLTGGTLLSRSFFSQKAGFCVMYKAAIQEPEVLYLSEKFQSKHPPLAAALTHLSGQITSKWKVIRGSLDEARACSKKFVCLCKDSEDKKTHKKNGLQVHTAASFLRKIQNSSCKKNQSGFWK